jgi:hypothetical protein
METIDVETMHVATSTNPHTIVQNSQLHVGPRFFYT